MPTREQRISFSEPAGLWGAVLLALLLSGISPEADRYTWLLEAAPVMIGLILLALTWRSYPLTLLSYRLLSLHAVILMIGAYYTYAEVPLFNHLRDNLELSRNHYDRVGHFVQGFVPAILTREILLRSSPLTRGGWLGFLTISFCLAFSAFYELIEWWVALLSEEAAEAFLGTQGDPWDTQMDMFLALTGALCALLLLSRSHDRQLSRL
jgi:putative membrane protein